MTSLEFDINVVIYFPYDQFDIIRAKRINAERSMSQISNPKMRKKKIKATTDQSEKIFFILISTDMT